MTSFIITSTDRTKRQDYIQKYCQELKINPLDITTIEKDAASQKLAPLGSTAIKQNAQTIGIEEIKNLQKKLFLKPIKSSTKAIVIQDAQLLTTEAQNALLKSLEEPPEHTIIILSSDSKEPLLPTILSRCQIIEIQEKPTALTEKEKEEFQSFLKNISNMPAGELLKKAEALAKDKQKAVFWIEKLILVAREELLQTSSSKTPAARLNNTIRLIKYLQKAHSLLKTTNVNPRFLLEHFFFMLQYPHEPRATAASPNT